MMQEELRESPWRLLVACTCLNLASARQARPVWERFFSRWPTPESLFVGDTRHSSEILEEMEEMFRPIGFQKIRSLRIWRMTFDYLVVRPDLSPGEVGRLHGVGKYARDSFVMFVGGEVVEDAQDKELSRYVQWALSLTGSGR